jgi:glycosyltransferase involved in cell wall biosynthesis
LERKYLGKPMKIGFIGAEGVPYPAGFANWTEEVGKRLVERGHEVTVWSKAHCVANTDDYLGMKRIPGPSLNTKHLDTITNTLIATLRSMTHALDIVHFHGIGPSVWSFLPKATRAKTVVHVHGLDWQRAKWGWFARSCLKLSEYSSTYLPSTTAIVSKTLVRYFESKFDRTVHYLPGGVEMTSPIQPAAILEMGLKPNNYLLFVGRLVPEKGCHHLLQAFREIQTNMRLVIVGQGRHSGEYEKSLKQLTDSRVLWTGYVDEAILNELFSNSYAFVQPSEIEGLPHAVLQAMAFGNCVVVSDIEENLEAMNGYGYSFRNGDYKDLKRVLELLLNDCTLVQAHKQIAREYVQTHFSWSSVTDIAESIYRNVLAGK